MKNKIINVFENAGLVDENNREIILFGLNRFLDIAISWLITIICACFMGNFLVGIIFEASYMILRRYAGGYHTRSKKSCIILTYSSTFVCLLVVFTVPIRIVGLVVIFLLSNVAVIRYAPVQSENKPLNIMERKVYRIKAICISLFLTMLIVIMLLMDLILYAKTISISLLLVTFGIAINIIKNCLASID